MTETNTTTPAPFYVVTGQRHFSRLGDIVVRGASPSLEMAERMATRAGVCGGYVHHFPSRAEALETYPEVA
jgi:hypothetical protein